MPIRKWFQQFLAPTQRRAPRRDRARPTVEALEGRVVPAAFVEVEGAGGNNTAATANVVDIAIGDILTTAPRDWLEISGSLGVTPMTDVADFFRFTLPAGAPGLRYGVFFDIDARDIGLSGNLDSVLTLFNDDGSPVLDGNGDPVENDDGFDFEEYTPQLDSAFGSAISLDSSLYADLNPGTYVIRVDPFSTGTATGAYQLRMLADNNYASSVPILNTRPGATDTFYLDFDGHSSSTDAWTLGNGAYTGAPFDFNGNAGIYSPAERLAISNVVRVVGEDYAPFNVNISTVAPATFVDGVSLRMVITNSPASIVGGTAGVIGLAFLNSYASTFNPAAPDSIAWTFGPGHSAEPATIPSTSSETIMAYALDLANTTTHELGHTLGLNHYFASPPPPPNPSPGVTVQPGVIMSTNSSGPNRLRFFAGIADNGTASGIPQVDLDVIGNVTNTFGLVPDDHGDSSATARVVLPVGDGSVYNAAGIIRTAAEPDFFSFFAGGPTTVNVNVDDFSANLGLRVQLLDLDGVTVLDDVTPTAPSMDVTFNRTLPTDGRYFIAVSSDGVVGSVGQYTVNVTTSISAAPVVTASPGVSRYIQNGPPVAVDPGLTVSDIDDTRLVSATVQITGGYVLGQDVLSIPNGNGVLSFFDVSTGTLTLFGSATVLDYQAALRLVTYTNIGTNTFTTGTRTLTFRANDGNLSGPGSTRDLTVSIAPVLTATVGTTAFAEGPTPVAIDPGIRVTDGNSTDLMAGDITLFDGTSVTAVATVQIIIGYTPGQDVLAFPGLPGVPAITGTFDAATGTLTLTGTASVADYQRALRLVTYANTSNGPSLAARVVRFTATDGIAPGPSVTKTIGIAPANNGPTTTVPAGPLNTVEDTARPISGISVGDPDSAANAMQVTLSVVRGTITVDTTVVNGVTAAQVSGNGTNRVVLVAPPAALNATFAANPIYTPQADFVGTDVLTVFTSDLSGSGTGGPALTAGDAVALVTTAVNDAPVPIPDVLPTLAAGAGPQTIPIATLLANDLPGPADEAGQTLTLVSVGGAVGGTVAIVGTNVVFTPTAGFSGPSSFTYTIQDNGTTNGAADPRTATGGVSFAVPVPPAPPAPPPPPPPPAPGGSSVGANVGALSLAALFDPSGGLKFVVNAFPGFTVGRLSTTVGDVNGDGTADLIVGTVLGGFSVVRVFNGTNGSLMNQFLGFPTTAPGITVASRDTNGDGRAEIFVSPLGFPLFAVFSGRDQSFIGVSAGV